MTPARRFRRDVSETSGSAETAKLLRPSEVRLKPTSGYAIASRRTTSPTAVVSARSLFKNFSRAGVAKNKSLTSMRVPCEPDVGFKSPTFPAVISNCIAEFISVSPPVLRSCRGRDVMVIFDTAPIEGNASPRKPSVDTRNRRSPPSPSGNLDVA